MADKYGGLFIPAPPAPTPGAFPPEGAAGDILLGYVCDFIYKIVTTYAGDAWDSIQPGKPIIRTAITSDPEDGFNEAQLPAIYVYRPGREVREAVETFILEADDYRFHHSRLICRWIMDPTPQEVRRQRNQMIDTFRKVVDRAMLVGRDPAWVVPGDPDPKAASQGSGLALFAGFAVCELEHAVPSNFIWKMAPPAPQRSYDQLILSFHVEELLVRDIDLIGGPSDVIQAEYDSPDQGTGLGKFILGEAIYK